MLAVTKFFYYNDSYLDSHLWIKKIRCTAGRLSFKDEVNWCYITMLYDWDWFRKFAPPLSHSSFAALSLSPWDVYLADSRNFFYEFNRMTLHLIIDQASMACCTVGITWFRPFLESFPQIVFQFLSLNELNETLTMLPRSYLVFISRILCCGEISATTLAR